MRIANTNSLLAWLTVGLGLSALHCSGSAAGDGSAQVGASSADLSVSADSGSGGRQCARHRHRGDEHEKSTNDLYVGCRDMAGTILHYDISTSSGAVSLVDTALANAAVSNTAIDACEEFLYVAHTDTGRISTFSRDAETGTLTLEGFVDVPGAPDPTSNPATQTLEIDHTGRFLLAANYTANTVLVYAIQPNGLVGNLVASRQDGLNAHDTQLTRGDEFALVPYLGSNYIATYRFNSHDGSLTPHTPFLTEIPTPMSGPRHLALHPNASWLYSISEGAGAIDLFNFDNRRGTLSHEQTVSSLPADFTGVERSGSEIVIDDAGKFLYVSNRLDQVANGILGVYSIARHTGALTPLQFEDSRGATPRQFSLSPDGKLLVVGNQSSDNMSVFKVNDKTGRLSYVATTPVCHVPFFARMVAP